MSATIIQIPSLCITRAYSRITQRVLYGTFERLFGKGCISELQMIPRNDRNTGEPYHLVFIHFHPYTPTPLTKRSDSVSPTLDIEEGGVSTTAEFQEDPTFNTISQFIAQLGMESEVRIEYRAPYFFKVRKYIAKPRRERPMPQILPSEESRATPARSPGNQSFDEYIKKMRPMELWLKLNEVKTVLAEFSESKIAHGSSPDILTRLEERWVEARGWELKRKEREWEQVPKKIQELVIEEFPPEGRIVNTPRKSEEEFRQMLVAKFNMGEL